MAKLSPIPLPKHLMLYFLGVLFLTISEVFVGPVFYSIHTRYSHPKYLAIVISLAFLPTVMVLRLIGLFGEELYADSRIGLQAGLIILVLIAIGLIVAHLGKRNREIT